MPSLPTIARSLHLVRRFITADVTWGDCLAATQAVVAMVGIRLALSVTSFGSVRKCLQRGVPPSRDFALDRDAESTAVDVASMARIVGLATRAMPASSTCLHRSLTLWWLLARRGITSELRLGVRKDHSRMQAHAWVEHQGRVVPIDRILRTRAGAPTPHWRVSLRTMRESVRKTLAMLPPHLRWRWAALVPLNLAAAAAEAASALVLVGFLGVVAAPGCVAVPPMVSGLLAWLDVGDDRSLLIAVAAGVLVVYLLRSLVLAIVAYFQAGLVEQSVVSVSDRVFRGYLEAPYPFHLRRDTAALIQRTRLSVDTAYRRVLSAGAHIAREVLVGLGLLAILAVVSPLITLVGASLTATLLLLQNRLSKRFFTESGEEGHRLNETLLRKLQQAFGGINEVQLSGRTDFFHDGVIQTRASLGRLIQKRIAMTSAVRMAIETAFFGVMILSVILVTLSVGTGPNTLALLGLFAYATFRLVPLANRIVRRINRARSGQVYVDRVYDDYTQLVNDSRPSAQTSVAALPLRQTIALEDVSYAYQDDDGKRIDAVRSLSLTIGRGESVGMVGRTGAGKTTLVNLILGLLEPTGGRITADGTDIQADIRSWQTQVGYVPQDVFLLDDTLRRNIAFGEYDAAIDDERVQTAVRLARLGEFVAALPAGLESRVGERGVRLSGGQRQRVAIARALYRQPEVLIFDEATSALDPQTESEVADAIGALRGTRTIIVVSHRLSTVRRCDRIAVIDTGQVTAVGSYDELTRMDPAFRRITGAPAA